ncbi:MAG TPA: hypothetical protein VHQ47_08820 [Phycisphaerae bacterium]|nr:hypothetical protein [Phycisphaerae bacterium]
MISLSLDQSIARDFSRHPTPQEMFRNTARFRAACAGCTDIFNDEVVSGGRPMAFDVTVGKSGTRGAGRMVSLAEARQIALDIATRAEARRRAYAEKESARLRREDAE